MFGAKIKVFPFENKLSFETFIVFFKHSGLWVIRLEYK